MIYFERIRFSLELSNKASTTQTSWRTQFPPVFLSLKGTWLTNLLHYNGLQTHLCQPPTWGNALEELKMHKTFRTPRSLSVVPEELGLSPSVERVTQRRGKPARGLPGIASPPRSKGHDFFQLFLQCWECTFCAFARAWGTCSAVRTWGFWRMRVKRE